MTAGYILYFKVKKINAYINFSCGYSVWALMYAAGLFLSKALWSEWV